MIAFPNTPKAGKTFYSQSSVKDQDDFHWEWLPPFLNSTKNIYITSECESLYGRQSVLTMLKVWEKIFLALWSQNPPENID